MKRAQVDQMLLIISITAFFLMSFSFVLMPAEQIGVVPGVVFWLGLAIGVALQITLELRRRSFFAKYHVKRETMQKPRNGFLTFGSSLPAKIADYSMLGSAVATVLAFIITKGYGFICYVFIATTLLALCMHCILNGRILIYVKNQSKIRKMLEAKKSKGEGEK